MSFINNMVLLLFQESVELPLTHPEYYEEMGIKPPKGVILYGAPGTGTAILLCDCSVWVDFTTVEKIGKRF